MGTILVLSREGVKPFPPLLDFLRMLLITSLFHTDKSIAHLLRLAAMPLRVLAGTSLFQATSIISWQSSLLAYKASKWKRRLWEGGEKLESEIFKMQ